MTPRVSIIIPMYNSEGTIARTLESLREQSRPDWEAIVVGDGSTDLGPARVTACSDPRITLLRQANAGPSAARNRGLARATGDFVCFVDSDDWLLPAALEQLLAAADRAPSCGACGGLEVYDAEGRFVHAGANPTHHEIGWNELLDANRLAPGTHIEPRSALGGCRFDERLRLGEDYDLWLRLAESGLRWRTVPAPVSAYRVRPRSLSRNFAGMLRSVRGIIDRAYDRAAASPEAPASGPDRRAAALRAHTLESATMLALGDDDPAQSAAAGLVRESCGRLRISPSGAAAAVKWGAVFGWGVAPTIQAREYWTRASAWWARCAREGWGPVNLEREALDALADLLVPRDEVVQEMVGFVRGARSVTVVGYGNNGQALVRALRDAGIMCLVRDDRSIDAGPADGIAIVPMDAPTPEGPVIITPDRDEGLVARFAGARPLLRWSEIRRRLAGSARAALQPARLAS